MTSPHEVKAFDISGEVPHGTTLLRASAGTGKTWSITAIVTRAILEGDVDISQVLLVTFNRSAARQMRHRTYARLARTAEMLESGLPARDDLDHHLLAQRERRDEFLSRARSAIQRFSTATIATTHEFCARMLTELGVLADHDLRSSLLADPTPLVDEVSADLYLSRYSHVPRLPSSATIRSLARTVAAQYGTVELQRDSDSRRVEERLDIAEAVRTESSRRMRAGGLHTFDDLIEDLARSLGSTQRGRVACATLADRFHLVMVDEFQDTDPLQWEILASAFHGRSDLWLIGDPKQSIYAFRGADIHAYLAATRQVDHTYELTTNWRSDQGIVDGVDQLFRHTHLGAEGIEFTTVSARHAHRRLQSTDPHGYDWSHPVQIRCITASDGSRLSSGRAEDLIAKDVGAQITAMLDGRSQWQPEKGQPSRPLQAGDIAVLVTARRRGTKIQNELRKIGQPAVFTGSTSVWSSPAATDFLDLLSALDDPDPTVISRIAMSRLIGAAPYDLARQDSQLRSALAMDIANWALAWSNLGPWGVIESLLHRPGSLDSMLTGPQAERYVTDLRQLAQETHVWACDQPTMPTPAQTCAWVEDQARYAPQETPRRLETDRNAVTIMTVHQAKGLEFPVVLLPDATLSWISKNGEGTRGKQRASRTFMRDDGSPLVWFDGERRVLNLSDVNDPARLEAWAQIRHDALAEELRKLYVALTRGQSAVRLWWAPVPGRIGDSGLQRLLALESAGSEAPVFPEPVDEAAVSPPWLSPRVGGASIEAVPVEVTEAPSRELPVPPVGGTPATFTRSVDHQWKRTSYSGLTAGIHGATSSMADLVDASAGQDEPDEDALGTSPDVSPSTGDGLCTMPGGTSFGLVVHEVLEHVDTSVPDLSAEITNWTTRKLRDEPIDGVAATNLAAGLVDVMHTDLGELAPGQCLADFKPSDRLAELDFEMRMAPSSSMSNTVGALAQALSDRSLVPENDPLASYGRALATSPAASTVLSGYLTGSIDAVLRRPDGRFLVIDYKTNRAPRPAGQPLEPRAYDVTTMTSMMISSHYPLQALLYSAALHRYLSHTMPGYDPATCLGPVGYLFVRAMAGVATPADASMPYGVFTWPVNPALVVAVSDILGGRHEH